MPNLIKTGWIAIFKGGRQTDGNGKEHDGTTMIDKAVEQFDPKFHEPPVVIGHPKNNAPAFGWVESLKKEGDFLMARFKDVQPEFAEMVKKHLFKKRSAAFYQDGRLRHVGFLGAAAPAVKGLPDFTFSEDEETVFEFSDYRDDKFFRVGRILRNLREFLLSKYDEETANSTIDNWDIDFLMKPEDLEKAFQEPGFEKPSKPLDQEDDMTVKTFSEEELKKAKEEGKEEALKEAEKKSKAEFSEKDKGTDDRIKDLEKKLDDQKVERKRDGIRQFTENLKREGKLLPAYEKLGLSEFMESLDDETAIEFTEGDKKTSTTQLKQFKEFLAILPKTVNFSEISKEENQSAGSRAKSDHLQDKSAFNQESMEQHTKATEFAEKNKCTYEEALDRI